MAFINLTSNLIDPAGGDPSGNLFRFTHMTTTGQTIEGFIQEIELDANGHYDVDLQYGNVMVTSKDVLACSWTVHGTVTVNSDTAAIDIPSLLGITTPPSDADLLVFQALNAESAVSAQEAATASTAAETAAQEAATSAQEAATSAQEAATNNTPETVQSTVLDAVSGALDTSSYSPGDSLYLSGYSVKGIGGATWSLTSTAGQAVSQTPAQLASTAFNDATGRKWELAGRVCYVQSVGVVGDLIADDTSAFIASMQFDGAINYQRLSGIRITSQVQLPAGSVLCSGGTHIYVDYSNTGSSVAILPLGGVTIDELNLTLMAGRSFNRFVYTGTGTEFDAVSIGKVHVTSVDQINNRSNSLHGAVKLGSNNTIGRIKVNNFDNCVSGSSISNLDIGKVYCESYVRGFHLNVVDAFHVLSVICRTASPNASQDPGHNGVLLGGVTNGGITKCFIEDSGEHAFRIGGDTVNPSFDLTFGTITAKRPGQCGVKINPDVLLPAERITIAHIDTTDCATGNAVGLNEDPVRIEKSRDVTIGTISATASSKANCGYDGIHINNCYRVHIGSATIENPLRAMLYISDESGACADISIGTFTLNSTQGTVVTIDSPTQPIEHVKISDGYARDTMPNTPCVVINNSGVPSPIIIGFDVDVTGWTSPGAVTSADLISVVTASGRIYNEMRPRN